MADDQAPGALTILWILGIVLTLVFLGFEVAALSEDPPAALFGLGGACIGALLTTLVSMTRSRRRAKRPLEALDAVESLAERMQAYELGQDRMAELEERLEFAERLLAERRHQPLLSDDQR